MKLSKYFLTLLLCLQSPFGLASGDTEQPLVHVVLLWLKEPGNQQHRQQFISASRQFVSIPGVIDMRIGEPVPSDRAIVDDSFDVGLYVTVKNQEALQRYLAHPIHKDASKIAKTVGKKLLVYDFADPAIPH